VKSKSRGRYRNYHRNRLEILRSAAREFSRNGFAQATMQEIADCIQMTKANLYYYFRSKQELLFFCQDYSLDRMLEEARQIVRRHDAADVQLHRIIRAQLRCMLDDVQGSAAHIEFRDLPPALLGKIIEKRDQYEHLLRRLVKRGMDQGVFRECDVRAAVWAMLGALNWTAQWYSPNGSLSVEEIGEQFADLLVGGLKSESVTARAGVQNSVGAA
jgi:AcrR family transcriptional regulator